MFKFLLGNVIVLMISLCLAATSNAEIIILQSGQRIVGRVIERTELRVTVDVKGVPQTFFLGEIASIDGVRVEPLENKNIGKPVTKVKKFNRPPYMFGPNARQIPNASVWTRSPGYQQAVKLDAVVLSMYEMMGKMANMNRNVVSTPDGGIIIVGPEKIIKYDKNLNVVKEVDIKK